MSTTRRDWNIERNSLENLVDQLWAVHHLEGKDTLRRLIADKPYKCIVCRKRPKEGEGLYYPYENFSSNNDALTIAHKECVHTNRAARGLPVATVSPPLATVVPFAAPSGSSTGGAGGAGGAGGGSVGRTSGDDWYRGWHDGVKFGLDFQAPADASVEWFKGWQEGVRFASELKNRA